MAADAGDIDDRPAPVLPGHHGVRGACDDERGHQVQFDDLAREVVRGIGGQRERRATGVAGRRFVKAAVLLDDRSDHRRNGVGVA